MADAAPALFRFDYNSPYAYLAASRVDAMLGADRVRWEPIAFAFLLIAQRREPWSFHEPTRSAGRRECERRAETYGLPPMVWPPGWPKESYTLTPLRAAFVAEREGLLREFSAAAFARNFVAGTGLRDDEAVLDVCEEIGLDRADVRAALGGWAKERLREATDAAIAEGVPGVPTVTVAGEHFWGDDRLEDAARRVG
ncbi:MAG TPA: DsbA family protein [Capillimicrobium sp.]|nr:DsbA family protein [Capillimicrobium sp.]